MDSTCELAALRRAYGRIIISHARLANITLILILKWYRRSPIYIDFPSLSVSRLISNLLLCMCPCVCVCVCVFIIHDVTLCCMVLHAATWCQHSLVLRHPTIVTASGFTSYYTVRHLATCHIMVMCGDAWCFLLHVWYCILQRGATWLYIVHWCTTMMYDAVWSSRMLYSLCNIYFHSTSW